MRTFQFKLDCGATTCASAQGQFCRFLGVGHWGTTVCLLYRRDDTHEPMPLARDGEPDGWAKRLPECLAAEADNG